MKMYEQTAEITERRINWNRRGQKRERMKGKRRGHKEEHRVGESGVERVKEK
jgi:hypothetical protein